MSIAAVPSVLITETDRLRLRKLSLDDVPALARILGDPEVMRFSIAGVRSEGETRSFIEWCRTCYAEHGFGQWAVVEKEGSRLLGFCGLSPVRVDAAEHVEVAYRLARDAWGRGVATEAALSVVAHGFERLELDSIVALVAPDNRASIRVVEKVGFSSFMCTRHAGWDVRVYCQRLGEWCASRYMAHGSTSSAR